jgi:hypothetical protein
MYPSTGAVAREAGNDVGLRLKKRREELDAVRVNLAEPEGLDVE